MSCISVNRTPQERFSVRIPFLRMRALRPESKKPPEPVDNRPRVVGFDRMAWIHGTGLRAKTGLSSFDLKSRDVFQERSRDAFM